MSFSPLTMVRSAEGSSQAFWYQFREIERLSSVAALQRHPEPISEASRRQLRELNSPSNFYHGPHTLEISGAMIVSDTSSSNRDEPTMHRNLFHTPPHRRLPIPPLTLRPTPPAPNTTRARHDFSRIMYAIPRTFDREKNIPPARKFVSLYAFQIRPGDRLEYGNQINHGCEVTACYPDERRSALRIRPDEPPPVKVNGGIRIQWRDPDTKDLMSQLFEGLDRLQVSKIVDDDARFAYSEEIVETLAATT